MSDTPPDRLSVNPNSPHFQRELLERGIGIRFKGAERRDVEEYCISEGWIRVALGKKMDRKGQPLTIKLTGQVEAWFERPAEGDPVLRPHPPLQKKWARNTPNFYPLYKWIVWQNAADWITTSKWAVGRVSSL